MLELFRVLSWKDNKRWSEVLTRWWMPTVNEKMALRAKVKCQSIFVWDMKVQRGIEATACCSCTRINEGEVLHATHAKANHDFDDHVYTQ